MTMKTAPQTVVEHLTQRLLDTLGELRLSLSHDEVPLGVESAMPGLEVRESTWADWEAAEAEALSA
jgi:hypothetical protein